MSFGSRETADEKQITISTKTLVLTLKLLPISTYRKYNNNLIIFKIKVIKADRKKFIKSIDSKTVKIYLLVCS